MGKWTARHNNRRHLAQAANLIDNAIAHLVEIRASFPESYEEHRKVLEVYAVALDDIKQEIDGYREHI